MRIVAAPTAVSKATALFAALLAVLVATPALQKEIVLGTAGVWRARRDDGACSPLAQAAGHTLLATLARRRGGSERKGV